MGRTPIFTRRNSQGWAKTCSKSSTAIANISPPEFFRHRDRSTPLCKRTFPLTTTDQWKDPARWYDTLYSQWDMKNQVLRSPDDRDGGSLSPYMVACDDTELGKPAYVAGKNIRLYPLQDEIDSVEAHIRRYVWGGLQ